MLVCLVAVGDELLSGDVADTNTALLARTLTAAGHRIRRVGVVGDDGPEVVAAVVAGLATAQGVIVYGGLGPTPDDVTGPALAHLPGAWTRSGLPNPVGSAEGVLLRSGATLVAALPGVPAEVEAMAPGLVEELGRAAPLARRSLHTALAGEPDLAAALADLPLPPGAKVAFLPRPGEVRVVLTAATPAELAPLEAAARSRLGDVVVGADEATLPSVLLDLLRSRRATLAVAESLTGGGLGAALTDVAGSSDVFRGGVTAYATELKTRLLGVDPGLVAAHGAVHPEVALAMARGVRARLGATYGLATTGVAGPDPQDGHRPGTVHVAVAGPDGERVASPLLRGDRAAVRRRTVVWAMDLARREVAGLPPRNGKALR